MRGLFITLIILGILAYFGYKKIKEYASNITFPDINFLGRDLVAILFGKGTGSINVSNNIINVTLSTTINNNNTFNIKVSGLYLELFYKGILLARSTFPHETFTIPKKSSITLTENISVYPNFTNDIVVKLLKKDPIDFSYTVKATLFGFFPLKFSSNFLYQP